LPIRAAFLLVVLACAVASAVGLRARRAPSSAGVAAAAGQELGARAVTTDFAGREDEARAIAVQPDGKLVLAGSSSAPAQERVSFALSRYLPDGRLDPGFGAGGEVITDLGSSDAGASDVFVMADGRIVAVGQGGRVFEDEGMGVMRYLPDGSTDPSFGGGDGYAKVGRVEYWGHDCLSARAVALQRDGKVVLAGSVGCGGEAGGMAIAVARLLPDGRLDSSFDGDGTQTFDFGPCAFATAVVVGNDGKILVAGGDGGCY
jgi:uncharacterized delta-60 repeat protein